MLTSLIIENYAIVSKLEIDFHSGLTVFTGETGAGKSIMIDALILLLGGRADPIVVRTGCEKCDIQAAFLYDEQGKETEVVLRRVIYAEGRSKSYLNGELLPLQKIKEFCVKLINIHGQHHYQTLLHPSMHRQQLDTYAAHDELIEQVADKWRLCQRIQQELSELEPQDSANERKLLLQYQLEELQQLDLKENELSQLNQEHQRLSHAQAYLLLTQQLLKNIDGEEKYAIRRQLHQALQSLAQLPASEKTIQNTRELLSNAVIQCEEARDEIRLFDQQIEVDPERLAAVESRISNLHHIAKKHHIDVNDLRLFQNQLQKSLLQYQANTQRLEELTRAYQQACHEYDLAAQALSHSRQKYAQKMAKDITQRIQALGMPKGSLTVLVEPLEKANSHGIDKVEYKVCTNLGMTAESLSKIASGGELSRISLAITLITATRASIPTLLFDEVDVGIGGATAALVGQMLRSLGERLQVFCVTHQPQVAAGAHHHFRIEKHVHHDQTFSHVIALDSREKETEIARMLGGLSITEETRLHAKSMIAESV
jgi:DNA repair protein RecN (Recombination protein N)